MSGVNGSFFGGSVGGGSVDLTPVFDRLSALEEDQDFQTTAGATTADAGDHWIITPGETFTFPAAPNDGDTVRTLPQGGVDWLTLAPTFQTSDAATVAAGQSGVNAGSNLLTWVYSAADNNWAMHTDGAPSSVGGGAVSDTDHAQNFNNDIP